MEQDIPKKYQKLYQRAKKGSRKAKIRFHCLECVGFSESEIVVCTSKICIFYDVRLKG